MFSYEHINNNTNTLTHTYICLNMFYVYKTWKFYDNSVYDVVKIDLLQLTILCFDFLELHCSMVCLLTPNDKLDNDLTLHDKFSKI